jgi:hypothetical protein
MLTRSVPRLAAGFGVSGLIALGLMAPTAAQTTAQRYPPYGPTIPTITNTEPQSGAYFREREAPPNPWNEESIWNMKLTVPTSVRNAVEEGAPSASDRERRAYRDPQEAARRMVSA